MSVDAQRAAVRLVREPIDVAALVREVADATVGAVATFVGVVRRGIGPGGQPLVALEYTAYEPMALAEMERLAQEALRQYELHAVRVVHRLGRLNIGEASVAVVVSAPHRAAAFDACREIIERLKVQVPIFKREIWSGGAATWVNSI